MNRRYKFRNDGRIHAHVEPMDEYQCPGCNQVVRNSTHMNDCDNCKLVKKCNHGIHRVAIFGQQREHDSQGAWSGIGDVRMLSARIGEDLLHRLNVQQFL